MLTQPQALPTPFLSAEVKPSRDEERATIEQNLAGDEKLCVAITNHLVGNYWQAYLQMQMKFWPIWDLADRSWRASLEAIDLNLMQPSLDKKNFGIAANPNIRDGFTLRVSPTDIHKQLDALLKVGLQISWQEGLPVGAVKPEYVFETMYNPTHQTVDAVNEVLSDTAHECGLHIEYRKNFHQFLKYGHAWGSTDLRRTFEDLDVRYPLGTDMTQVQAALQMLAQRHGQQPQLDQDQRGIVAIFKERRVKEFVTSFKHLNVQDVFTDLTMSCEDMDTHPCPFVRAHLAPFQLEQNEYNDQTNPFGWMNIQKALTTTKGDYTLSAEDEGVLRAQLVTRFGISDQNLLPPEFTKKQLWTAYPMLRVSPDGKLDTGGGVDCPTCTARGTAKDESGQEIPCPTCAGNKKLRPLARRFTVQWYGAMRGPQTCVRIQPMPKGMRVPLLFAADMIEDTSCAIPLSKVEVAMNDNLLLAKCENLFLHSKDMAIHRGWRTKIDSPAASIDKDKPNVDIPFDSDPRECDRISTDTFDETITLAPYMAERRERIKNVMGATDQLIGIIESGRRSATELGNAIDASKNPIVVMTDNYNRQMPGRWADAVVRNLDQWGDRDWIYKKTGREFFGKLRFKTAVGEEFIRKLTRIQNEREIMQMLPAIASICPQIVEVVPQILQQLMNDMGMSQITVPDGGMRNAQQIAMRIVSKILGDGQLVPPGMNDPDEIYIAVFTDAIRAAQEDPNDYWYGKSDTTLPLLQQRLQWQQQIAFQKQQQAMMMQAQQQALGAHAEAFGKEKGAPRDPKKGARPAANHGEAMQNSQGNAA